MTHPLPLYIFVFDVESIGLHGEGFAAGWVTVRTEDGGEIQSGQVCCERDRAVGDGPGRDWVRRNVPTMAEAKYPADARRYFWECWEQVRGLHAVMAADCPWPVEARFLLDCLRDDPRREGPYPLIDVASVRLAAGLDPLGTEQRLPDELPVHNPLADARQSARLLVEALGLIRRGGAKA